VVENYSILGYDTTLYSSRMETTLKECLVYVYREFFNRLTDKIRVLLSTFPVRIPSHHIWHGHTCCDNGFFAGKGIFFYSVL
jgi:hypothetical protein